MTEKHKEKKRVAVIGYGSQGRAIAQNLRDSGFDVTIGLRERSRSNESARADQFKQITTISEAVRTADIVCFAFPDHLHGTVFEESIRKNLPTGCCLWFLHGLSVHFGMVEPPEECDLILIAPHAPGGAVREKYLSDRSLSAFYAVQQDVSGEAESTALMLAEGIGLLPGRIERTTFEQEAVGDMFGEQAVLCGGLAALIKNGFEVLVEDGFNPDHAYLEVAYQLDLIVDLIKQHGITGMFERISVAARYGSYLSGPRIIDESVKGRMMWQLKEIKEGKFAAKLASLTPAEIKTLNKALGKLSHPEFEKSVKKYRG